MPVQHDFVNATVSGSQEVSLQGSHDVRIISATNTPEVIGLIGGVEGVELCVHNLSGVSVPVINDSPSASAPNTKILTTGLGGDFLLPSGQIVWAILVDPNDANFPDADRGWYLDSGGQEVLVRSKTTATTSAPTTASATPAVIPEMTITCTTVGGEVVVLYSMGLNVLDGDAGEIQLYVDGSPVASTLRTISFDVVAGSNNSAPGFTALVTGLSVGAHTFEAQWRATAGSLRANGTQRGMQLFEIPP